MSQFIVSGDLGPSIDPGAAAAPDTLSGPDDTMTWSLGSLSVSDGHAWNDPASGSGRTLSESEKKATPKEAPFP
jgi:hypothetical protein